MPDEFKYYQIRKHHGEILGRKDPCSFHELLFAVEAPGFISGIDIWQFTEDLGIGDVDSSKKSLSLEERKFYPFYDLFQILWKGDIIVPFIFERKDEKLFCIEGRHRLRMLRLLHDTDKKEFNDRIGFLSSIVVSVVEERPDPRYPARYKEWTEWLSMNSWRKDADEMRAVYEKFLHQE